jgi:hypothetical protein
MCVEAKRGSLRVVAVAAAVQGLLLDAAADLINSGEAEAGDVEGVQHPDRAGSWLRSAVA